MTTGNHQQHPAESLDSWVDEQWAGLEPPPSSIPDAHRSYQQFQKRLLAQSSASSEKKEAAVVRDKPRLSKPIPWWFWVAAVLVMGVLLKQTPALWNHTGDEWTVKSSTFQLLYARRLPGVNKRYARSQWWKENTTLHPGDLIQFLFHLPKARNVMVASFNEKGEFFVYLPFRRGQAQFLRAGKHSYPIGNSLELDGVLGGERFFFITSRTSFAAKDVERVVRKHWEKSGRFLRTFNVSWPAQWNVSSRWIQKERRP